jgi:hypothetical protein
MLSKYYSRCSLISLELVSLLITITIFLITVDKLLSRDVIFRLLAF